MPTRATDHAQLLSFRRLALAVWRWRTVGGGLTKVGLSIAWLMRRARLAPTRTSGYALPGVAAWATGMSASATVAATHIASAVDLIVGSITLHRRDISVGAGLVRCVGERRRAMWAVRHITARVLAGSCPDLRGKGILLGRAKQTGGPAHLPVGTRQGSLS